MPNPRITDSYSPVSDAQAKAIKAAGYAGCARYLGAKTLKLPNGMLPAEAYRIRGAGLKLVSIWEVDPTHASYFTIEQARLDALHALEEATWVGQPQGTAIYFTVDFDAQTADMEAIIAYFALVRSLLSPHYLVGAYGGIRTLEALKGSRSAPAFYWQTVAWSAGQRFAEAALYQGAMDASIDGLGIDINDVLVADPGWWPPNVKYAPVVSPEYTKGWNDAVQAVTKAVEGLKK